jgi:hypothetical protein
VDLLNNMGVEEMKQYLKEEETFLIFNLQSAIKWEAV